jgi:hypothetical protein
MLNSKTCAIALALSSANAIQKSDADGLFKLMDANVTRGNLKNLVTDKPAPITVALAQKEAAKKDDNRVDHTLEGLNVTRGAMKKLVTDFQTPITHHNIPVNNKASNDTKDAILKDLVYDINAQKNKPAGANGVKLA